MHCFYYLANLKYLIKPYALKENQNTSITMLAKLKLYIKLTVTNIATIMLLKLYHKPLGSMRSVCSIPYVITSNVTPTSPIKSDNTISVIQNQRTLAEPLPLLLDPS